MAAPSKNTAVKLTKLIEEHGTFEFEGFKWLPANLDKLAAHLGVSRRTIVNVIGKPPFRRIVRRTKEHGKHVLIRVGSEQTESDRVMVLRSIWVKGLIFYNAALVQVLTMQVMSLKATGAPSALYDRRVKRLVKAEEGAANLDTLKAGGKVDLTVAPHVMGQLRGVVQVLGDDAAAALSVLVTFTGWAYFLTALKAEEKTMRYYDWPTIAAIREHPHIALQVYLDKLQEAGPVGNAETARLMAKIASLTPQTDQK